MALMPASGPAAPPASPPMMAQNGPQAPAPSLDMREAPPEQQEIYNEVVARGVMFMFDKRVTPVIIETMKAADDPAEGIADAAVMLFSRLSAALERAQQDVPGDVMFHAGAELFDNLVEIGETSGAATFEDDDAKEAAWFRTLDRIREQVAPAIDPEVAKMDAEAVRRVASDGTLDRFLEQVATAQGGNRTPAGNRQQAARGLMGGQQGSAA